MTSSAEWTGVLLSVLLKECGLKGGASWVVQSLPKIKMPIGDRYASLPEWKPRTPRLKGYPY
jgi:DMSO/TMAO reductase YedYZ molybdopterin-dependent catalytic subunit